MIIVFVGYFDNRGAIIIDSLRALVRPRETEREIITGRRDKKPDKKPTPRISRVKPRIFEHFLFVRRGRRRPRASWSRRWKKFLSVRDLTRRLQQKKNMWPTTDFPRRTKYTTNPCAVYAIFIYYPKVLGIRLLLKRLQSFAE